METRSMTRKEFVTLTFTLIGSAAAACSSSSSSNDGGTGGSIGSGGTNGTGGGHGTGGVNGTGGTSASTGAAGTSGNTCTNPLPETMVPDQTMHSHTLSIPASDLDATTDQTIDTGVTDAHMHMVTLTVANLGTLKGGGQVTVTSSLAGTPSHSHMFTVSCT